LGSQQQLANKDKTMTTFGSKQQQRRVQFAVDKTGRIKESQSKPQHQLLETDLEQCWWQPADFIAMRRRVRELHSALEDRKVLMGTSDHKSYRRTMSKVQSCCFNRSGKKSLPASTLRDLEYWVRVENSPRGLEKFILPSLTRQRLERREDVIMGVLLLQDECWLRGLSQPQTESLLQAKSEKESKHAKKYARIMAAIDDVVASTQSGEEKEHEEEGEEGERGSKQANNIAEKQENRKIQPKSRRRLFFARTALLMNSHTRRD